LRTSPETGLRSTRFPILRFTKVGMDCENDPIEPPPFFCEAPNELRLLGQDIALSTTPWFRVRARNSSTPSRCATDVARSTHRSTQKSLTRRLRSGGECSFLPETFCHGPITIVSRALPMSSVSIFIDDWGKLRCKSGRRQKCHTGHADCW
jgi:hypothetical protein